MDTLKKDLLSELECPVCMEYMIPPITLCENGHNTCNICKQKLKTCPSCKGKFTNVRCYAFEKLACKVQYPCKYRDSGCRETFHLEQITLHQDKCKYQPIQCPFRTVEKIRCTFSCSSNRMASHIETLHPASYYKRNIEGPTSAKLPDFGTSTTWYQAQFMDGEVFFWYSKLTENFLYSIITHVGPEITTLKYKYALTIENADGTARASACHVAQHYRRDVNDLFKYGDCPSFNQAFVKNCVGEDNQLAMNIDIFKISD